MSFLFINKTLRLNNLKPRTAMNAKILGFVIYVEAIIYLLLYNLHDCTFKQVVCFSKQRYDLFDQKVDNSDTESVVMKTQLFQNDDILITDYTKINKYLKYLLLYTGQKNEQNISSFIRGNNA